MRALVVSAPPFEEQRRIVQELQDRLSSARSAARPRRAVLECAFRGELIPQDPSDEPAEIILARIHGDRGILGG